MKARQEWASPGESLAERMIGENGIAAQNVLREEMGVYGEPEWNYDIDERTKNTLLAHTRQDVAHALLNTIALLRGTENLLKLSTRVRALQVWMFVLTLGIGFLVWKGLHP